MVHLVSLCRIITIKIMHKVYTHLGADGGGQKLDFLGTS